MSIYEFTSNDSFINQLETHPRCNFFISASGDRIYNADIIASGAFGNNVKHVPRGYISLYEENVDRPADSLIYPFVIKNGTETSFRTMSTSDFNSDFVFGDTITGSYPLSASITIRHYADISSSYTSCSDRLQVNTLKNLLNSYSINSPHYRYSSSLGNKAAQELTMVDIPSIFFGSSIEKGSVELRLWSDLYTSSFAIADTKRNGELIETTGSNIGSIAGVVLYKQGIILLTGSWAINNLLTDELNLCDTDTTPDYVRWFHWGTPLKAASNNTFTSWTLKFNGINYIPVLTLFAHAPEGELNYSSNPTYIQSGQTLNNYLSGAYTFRENNKLMPTNTVKSPYTNHSGSFKKQTYISKIALMDDNKRIIGYAKLATPLKKTEDRGYSFKLRLDI